MQQEINHLFLNWKKHLDQSKLSFANICSEMQILQKSITKKKKLPPDITKFPKTKDIKTFIEQLPFNDNQISSFHKIWDLKQSIVCSKDAEWRKKRNDEYWALSDEQVLIFTSNLNNI